MTYHEERRAEELQYQQCEANKRLIKLAPEPAPDPLEHIDQYGEDRPQTFCEAFQKNHKPW